LRAKKSNRYQSVDLPTELVDAVRRKVIEPASCYTSIADFVKSAVREKLERLSPMKRHTPPHSIS
jgi:Arc/MetJ-type ribon-helix-helix transcriptional regulator